MNFFSSPPGCVEIQVRLRLTEAQLRQKHDLHQKTYWHLQADDTHAIWYFKWNIPLCNYFTLNSSTPNSSITPQSLGWKYKEPRLACKHKAKFHHSFWPGGRKIPNNGCNHVSSLTLWNSPFWKGSHTLITGNQQQHLIG